jgi:hypothetical protein
MFLMVIRSLVYIIIIEYVSFQARMEGFTNDAI